MNNNFKQLTRCLLYLTVILLAFSTSPALIDAQAQAKKQDSGSIPTMEYDVIIDIGHGGVDGGTSYDSLLEKQLNLEIGSKLYYLLKEKGFQVGVTRLHDYALSDDSPFNHIKSRHQRDLTQRWLIAEELKPKLFISIHINFSPHRYIKGPVIIYQNQAESFLIGQLLQKELNELSHTKKRSRLDQHYFLLKKITQPSLIAEVGYISNPGDRALLQDPEYQQKLAQHMTSAIEQYFLLYP